VKNHRSDTSIIKTISSASIITALMALGLFAALNIEAYRSTAREAVAALSGEESHRPGSLLDFVRKSEGVFHRASSGERKGNRDYITIGANKAVQILNVSGSGVIHRLWVTVLSADPSWTRMITIEMYWDGEKTPGVRAPLGDFFGASMGNRIEFQSSMLAVMPHRGTGFNSLWPMPFEKGARIVVRNDSPLPVQAFYYQIDYTKLEKKPSTALRFYAAYSQSKPKGFDTDMVEFEIADIDGVGCYAGHFLGVHNSQGGWFGEGDEIIEVDGRILQGTGLEDAFGAAWRPVTSSAGQYFGYLTTEKSRDNWKGFHSFYRFYVEPPICFSKSIKVSFERRPQDRWSAVAYWYRAGAVAAPPNLPLPQLREPPRGKEGAKALKEARELYIKIYNLAGWPDKFISFDTVGDIIARTDLLFEKEDYQAALRLLRAAARSSKQ